MCFWIECPLFQSLWEDRNLLSFCGHLAPRYKTTCTVPIIKFKISCEHLYSQQKKETIMAHVALVMQNRKYIIFCGWMYSFSISGVANYHKLSCLKQRKHINSQLCSQSLSGLTAAGFTMSELKFWLAWALRKNLLSRSFRSFAEFLQLFLAEMLAGYYPGDSQSPAFLPALPPPSSNLKDVFSLSCFETLLTSLLQKVFCSSCR